jgi:hypothetical protein
MLAFGGVHIVNVDAQIVARRPDVGSIVHVRSISPRSGPAGTVVRIRASGLPANTPVYVALGALNTGYEVDHVATTDERGGLAATLKIADHHKAHWDHFHAIVILREKSSEVLATSDAFHITNEEGFVQRRGVIEIVQPGCAALRSWDGLTYALTGDQASSLAASIGHEITVEGPIVEGTCGLQNAIDVARTSLPSVGR